MRCPSVPAPQRIRRRRCTGRASLASRLRRADPLSGADAVELLGAGNLDLVDGACRANERCVSKSLARGYAGLTASDEHNGLHDPIAGGLPAACHTSRTCMEESHDECPDEWREMWKSLLNDFPRARPTSATGFSPATSRLQRFDRHESLEHINRNEFTRNSSPENLSGAASHRVDRVACE